VSADNIARELTAAGKSWKVYAENLPSVGYTGGDALPYLKHHNPFAYFSDVVGTSAAANLVPFGNLSADLSSGAVPNFVYIEPNIYDDMHDCPPNMSTCTLSDRRKYCDAWLQANLAPILANSAFTSNGLLIVTFDESTATDFTNGGGHVLTILMSPHAKPGFSSSTLYQHQSLLRLMLEGLSVSTLPGAAASAPKMSEFFQIAGQRT
jgi:phosphatidylinositol-3-phosphatase